jgi:phage repressor protein C with HTH and peptisase S24 domain
MNEKELLKSKLGLEKDTQLAEFLGLTKQAISSWKSQGVPKYISALMPHISKETAGAIDKIPVFHMAGAGPPQISSGDIVEVVTLPDGFYRKGMLPVKIYGHSMEPVMLDGAIVGVDSYDKEFVSGKYYAVWIDDEGAVIKKLSSEPGRVFVESLNKNEHSFYVSKDTLQDHFILGRVKWWINQENT